MKKKILSSYLLCIVTISLFIANIPLGSSADEPIYSPNTQVIESWLKPTLYLVNDQIAQGGVDQVTANGLKFRVILGGVRLDNIDDKGKVELGKDIDGNTIYGYYKRYNMKMDILIRTLATKNDVVGPSVSESSITTRIVDYNFRKEVLTTYKHADYYFTVKDYAGLEDWRTYAAREYSAALGIRLSSDPSFQFPSSFDAQNGIYKLDGIWSGIVKVETPSNPSYEYGLLKDNVAIQSYIGNNLVTDSATNIQDPSVSAGKPESSEISTDTNTFIVQATVGNPTIIPDVEGAIVDYIYKQSQYPFDLYETSRTKFNFQYDPSITNKNYSDVYFPFNFRLKPETTIYTSVWPFNYATIYTNLIGPSPDSTGGDEGSNVITGLTVKPKTAWKVDNVWQKSSVIASIDIMSKYAFIPDLPDQPPLDDPDEWINQTIWSNIATGATNVTYTLPTGTGGSLFGDLELGDIFNYVIYIAIAIIAVVLIVRFAKPRKQ